MSEEAFGSTPTGPESSQEPAASEASWGAPQPQTPPPPSSYAAPPPGYVPAAAEGLSENTACALAYITFIPAIIFLVMPPYNTNPKIRFHAIQELGLSMVLFILSFFLVIPILGLLIYFVGGISVLILWVLCIIKASQGGAFKLPFLGDFAAQQSGYKM